MGRLTLRLSDELHDRLRKASGSRTVNGFATEAIAAAVGGDEARRELAELRAEIAEQRQRIERLERVLRSQQSG